MAELTEQQRTETRTVTLIGGRFNGVSIPRANLKSEILCPFFAPHESGNWQFDVYVRDRETSDFRFKKTCREMSEV